MTKNKETIEEFLARGGKIEKIPAKELEEQEEIVKSTANQPIQIMSLDWGEHYFAEKHKRKSMSAEEKNKKGKEKLKGAAARLIQLAEGKNGLDR